jgi:type II secretory pathway pseudopilin PulG
MTHRDHRDAGDTLAEVLVALLIVSLAVVALIGGLGSSIGASTQHKGLSTVDTMLKSYAETIKYRTQLQSSPLFTQCATVTTPSPTSPASSPSMYNGSPINFTDPTNYSIVITGIQFWNSATSTYGPTCTPTNADKSNFQLITVRACVNAPSTPMGCGVGGNDDLQTMQIGLRSPT